MSELTREEFIKPMKKTKSSVQGKKNITRDSIDAIGNKINALSFPHSAVLRYSCGKYFPHVWEGQVVIRNDVTCVYPSSDTCTFSI